MFSLWSTFLGGSCVSWTWVLPFCSLYSPFFWDAFGSFMVSTVSSSHPFLCFYLEQNFCPHFVRNRFSSMNSILHFNPEFSCWRWYLHGSCWTVLDEFFWGVLHGLKKRVTYLSCSLCFLLSLIGFELNISRL